MRDFACFGIMTGLSWNLLLQFGLGMAGAVSPKKNSLPALQLLCLFLSVLALFVVFFSLSALINLGFFEYILYYPLSCLSCLGLETVFSKVLPGKSGEKTFNCLSSYDGLALAALFLTRHLAETVAEGYIHSIYFSLGVLIGLIILAEIRRRSSIEKVPRFLRGKPLLLVSMGLLSLVFTAAAGIFYKILEF
jgi:electron transport complex protein RnfA